MSIYTLAEICEILERIEKYELFGREITKPYLLAELKQICNGAGPDSWSELSREIVTQLMSLFEPAVMIHDVRFQNSDGTKKTFEEVAAEWIENCRLIFDAEYPLWTWRMLRPSYRIARAAWLIVMKAGNAAVSGDKAFEAWKAAYGRRKAAGNA